MTAKVIPLRRRRSAGPCNSGTVPGEVSAPCGQTDTRLHAAGPRCPDHPPRPATWDGLFEVRRAA